VARAAGTHGLPIIAVAAGVGQSLATARRLRAIREECHQAIAGETAGAAIRRGLHALRIGRAYRPDPDVERRRALDERARLANSCLFGSI